MKSAAVLLIGLFLGLGCEGPPDHSDPDHSDPDPEPALEAVATGADVLRNSGFAVLAGKRVGLIANQTSRTGGLHLADLLHDHPEVRLAALFGPEHGLRGDADAGLEVEDGIDDDTGVPVYSLYGDRRAPDAEVLAELDVLVFDIQDVGARFYTYIATMGLAMEAAAAAGVPFVVLDRPNPLGGERVDGFVLESGFESFVGPYPIPVQHGLTVGELARMIQGRSWIEGASEVDLQVIPMEGWSRAMLWPDTGLPWIPTSPNIPTFEAALVYPGMCFLEATTANEGRGTETPFPVAGAPGLDGDRLAAAAGRASAGLTAEAHRYTPISLPGRSTNPRHRDTEVVGIRLTVTHAEEVRPLALGVQVLAELVAQMGPDAVRASGMNRLAGTERLTEALLGGRAADEIVQSWAEEVEAFRTLRAPYLLYD